MDFHGRTAIVTGATSGIGEETTRQLLEKGATVLAIGRNPQKGGELEALGRCKFYPCNLSDPAQIEAVCGRIAADDPKVDILVNNAGMSVDGTVETLSLESWEKIFALNVTSVFLMCKYIVPLMRANGYGRIVNIGSTAGIVGAWNLHAYSATKGAVVQLSRSMAAEYAGENILVNCVCPGGTLTPLMEGIGGLDEFAKLFPIGRLARPEEIARVIVFLSSEEASFMAGSTVLVDGGFTCV